MLRQSTLSMLITTFLVGTALAQVQVTGVDQGFQNGITVTISGSGFGTKSTAAPVFWDDLSSSSYAGLSHGDPVPTQAGLRDHPKDPNAPWPDADWIYSGHAGNTKFGNNAGFTRVEGRPVYWTDGSKGYLGNGISSGGDLLVVDFWYLTGGFNTFGSPAFCKFARIWPESGSNANAFISVLASRTSYSDCSTDSEFGGALLPTDNVWHHVRMVVDNSAGIENCASEITSYLNNVQKGHVSNHGPQPEAPGFSSPSNEVYLIGKDPNSTDPTNGKTDKWGDIYIDNTLAHVILADASTWSNVRHYEMQIPQTWQSSSIQVASNLGSFSPSDSVWLYVIDANGNVNQNGLSVDTVHETIERPGTPGQPVIVGS